MEKKEIFRSFSITGDQEAALEKYLNILVENNSHTNLVGRSTLTNPWNSHILDSLQIARFIENNKASILDMGSGAGIPGKILSIMGFKNMTIIDSNRKKFNFLKKINKELCLKNNIILGRLENINNLKFDIITCRALAKLEKLFTYSQKYLKKNTVMIFLKGKTVNDEIFDAQKKWKFEYKKQKSISDSRGSMLIIKNIKKL